MASMAQIYPLHIVIASLAGLMNRQQGEVLEYLIEENRVLREQLKGKALRLNDDQRRRLAAKGKSIGRRGRALGTIPCWVRQRRRQDSPRTWRRRCSLLALHFAHALAEQAPPPPLPLLLVGATSPTFAAW